MHARLRCAIAGTLAVFAFAANAQGPAAPPPAAGGWLGAWRRAISLGTLSPSSSGVRSASSALRSNCATSISNGSSFSPARP
jgi:hypothetical protein